jgi:ketosteroid isomerase-like protein
MKRVAQIVVLLLAAALNAQEASVRPEKAAVDQLFRDWSDAIGRGDATALGELVTDDVEFWGEFTPAIVGKANVIAAFTDTFKHFSLRQSFEEKERVWDEAFVIMRGIESTKISERGILKSTEMRRRIFVVARRGDDGRWRIARGMSNTPATIR